MEVTSSNPRKLGNRTYQSKMVELVPKIESGDNKLEGRPIESSILLENPNEIYSLGREIEQKYENAHELRKAQINKIYNSKASISNKNNKKD